MLRVDKHLEPELCDENISDWLSDRYGFCVNGCNVEICEYNETDNEIKKLIAEKKLTAEINKLKAEVDILNTNRKEMEKIETIAMEDAEGDEAMAMCISLTEKFNHHLEELTNDFEKTMTDIVEQLGGFGSWMTSTEPNPTNLIEKAKEENKPFPMDKVKDFIEYKIKGLMAIKEDYDSEELKYKDDWEEDFAFDINEAGEILEKYENDELFDLEDLEHKVENKVDENNEWWKKELMKLLGWDEDEGAKWNSPFNFDVKVRDIMEELEGRLNPSNEERDPETGEVIKKEEDDKKKDRREEILNKLHRQLENPFHPVGLEKADNENDTKYFQKVIDDRHLNEALFHMKMTEPVFGEYKNFRRFVNDINKPKVGCDYPFPPPQQTDKYKQFGETEEEEYEITKEYIKDVGLPINASIKHYINNLEDISETIKGMKKWVNSDRDYMIYDSVKDILNNIGDMEKIKSVGKYLYRGCNHIGDLHMEAMRSVYYIVSWYLNASGSMVIMGYKGLIEAGWNGIGEWQW